MFGFSKEKFTKDAQQFVFTHGANITEKVTAQGQAIINEMKEKLFPELKGYDRTPTVNGKYSFLIVMAGIKKENSKVNIKDGVLNVIGKSNNAETIINFSQPVGKDEVVSAKLEDGIMTVTLTEAPEDKTINVD